MTGGNQLYHLQSPYIFAHRGASAFAPENTIAAFELAIKQGADAIELDAKLCADGHVVVIHDQTVDRTTTGTGKVLEMTLAELQKLDAGSHFDIAFRGEIIPTLSQVFEAVGNRIYINIELSNYASKTDLLPEEAAKIVRHHDLNQWVMFSSFNPLALIRVKRILPDVPIGLLALSGTSGSWARSPLGYLTKYQALHPHFSDVDQGLVERIHRRGARVHPFTVNQAGDMLALKQLNIDGIITDDPMLARSSFDQTSNPVHLDEKNRS
jgi:glycerophosphoryl diester phosphodiesterase